MMKSWPANAVTTSEQSNYVLNSLRYALGAFLDADAKAMHAVRDALDSLVKFHAICNQLGLSNESHTGFREEVTSLLVSVQPALRLVLYEFDSFIECAYEEDTRWVCQRRSAVQFLCDDHAAAVPRDSMVCEAIESINERTIDHVKRFGGIEEPELRPVGFPASHWWWTGNIAYVEPTWVAPPGWPPKRQWHPDEPAVI